MKVSIVIASHGSQAWRDLAYSRAYPSALAQDADEVLIDHDPDGTRSAIRNRLTEKAIGDYIVTLDADDELAPGYLAALREACPEWMSYDTPPLLTPAVSYVRGRRVGRPRFWDEIPLAKGNWMVVGTAFFRTLMLSVGGWREFRSTGRLNEYDDWDLWIRLTAAGCQAVKVPDAVYIAHIGPHSAHRRALPTMRRAWHREIAVANGIETDA